MIKTWRISPRPLRKPWFRYKQPFCYSTKVPAVPSPRHLTNARKNWSRTNSLLSSWPNNGITHCPMMCARSSAIWLAESLEKFQRTAACTHVESSRTRANFIQIRQIGNNVIEYEKQIKSSSSQIDYSPYAWINTGQTSTNMGLEISRF